MSENNLRTLLRAVMNGHIQIDDYADDSDEMVRDVIDLFEQQQPIHAIKAAMYAVNFDFAQQAIQAYERATGKQ